MPRGDFTFASWISSTGKALQAGRRRVAEASRWRNAVLRTPGDPGLDDRLAVHPQAPRRPARRPGQPRGEASVHPPLRRATCRLRNRPRSLLVDYAIDMIGRRPLRRQTGGSPGIADARVARRTLPRRQRQASSSRPRAGVAPLLRRNIARQCAMAARCGWPSSRLAALRFSDEFVEHLSHQCQVPAHDGG
jgi:hypothetical protein